MSVNQREIGRRALLHEVRKAGQIARIELADRTGLSRATVTTITAELMTDRLIEEVPRAVTEAETRRGRPRVDLKIRGDAHLVAGAKIAQRSVSLVLLDFEGRRLAEVNTMLERPVLPPDALARHIRDAVQALARAAGHDISAISGIGLAIAGIVDAPRGFVYWSPSLSARNVPFAEVAQKIIGLPVFVDNDANLVAMAEQSFGLGRDESDFLVVTIESGLGLGVVINNTLYRGARGCGAEFGHTKIQVDGALCRCGQRGCLEAYVADYALLREAQAAGDGRFANGTAQDLDTLLIAAQGGDPMAQTITDRAGRLFAIGLANLVNIFDPRLIILAGEQMRFDHLYAPSVVATMQEAILQVDRAPPDVAVHKWGDLMWAMGAAAFALDRVSELAITGVGTHVA